MMRPLPPFLWRKRASWVPLFSSTTHCRYIKVVNILPGLGLGDGDVDFVVVERPAVPDVGEGRLGADAETAVVSHEKGDASGVEKGPRWKHVDEQRIDRAEAFKAVS